MLQTLAAQLLLKLIRIYQFLLSPWIGNSCRFWPTCSHYATEAIEQHGALRGGWMTLARLARCHPYSAGGVDPVPLQFRWRCWCDASRTQQSNEVQTQPETHISSAQARFPLT